MPLLHLRSLGGRVDKMPNDGLSAHMLPNLSFDVAIGVCEAIVLA